MIEVMGLVVVVVMLVKDYGDCSCSGGDKR